MDDSASTLEGLPSAETGRPPTFRFISSSDKNNGDALMSCYNDLVYCGNIKDFERAEIEAMMAHAPPYTQEQLKELNMENFPNSTRGELPRRIKAQASTWMDFAAGNSGLWKITFNNAPPELKDNLEEMAGECLNGTWMNFPKHTTLMLKAFTEHSKYGCGPVIWNDCYDPSPHAKMAWEIKYPKRTEIDLCNLTEFGCPDLITLKELYDAMERDKVLKGEDSDDEGGKGSGGWVNNEIIKIMKQAATQAGDGTRFPYTSVTEMTAAINNGASIWGKQFRGSAEIKVYRLWVQEYEPDEEGGIISFYTIAENGGGWRIIQRRPRHYVDWTSTIAAAVDSTGLDGTLFGLRGLGMDIRPKCRDMDILENARNWAANHRMTPHYSTPNASAADAAEQLVIRPNGIIAAAGITEFESEVDYKAGEDTLNSMSLALDTIQNLYAINAPNHKGTQRTAAEARQDAFKEQDARLSQILPMSKIFIVPLGREFARRLVSFPMDEKTGDVLKFPGWQVAKFFWDKVKTYPILEALLGALIPSAEVSVNPDATPDGLDKKLMKSQLAMEMLPLLKTDEQKDIVINRRLIGIYGHKAAIPIMNHSEAPMDTNLAAFIDAENADMLSGRPRRVFPEQDHFLHLGELDVNAEGHCASIIRELQEIQSGLQDQFSVDPDITMANRITSGLAFKAHIDAHILLASQNPVLLDSPQMQGYYDFASQLEQLLKQTIATFQKQMQARAEESGQQMDPKAQAILMKAEAEIAAGNQKLAAEIQREEIRTLTKLGNQQQTAESRRNIKQSEYTLNMAMLRNQQELKLREQAFDTRIRQVQELADAQRDLNKEKKEAEKEQAATASAPTSD